MTDNVEADAASGGAKFATLGVNFSGDAVQIPGCVLFGASGSEGAWTTAVLPGTTTDGLLVNLGSNNDVAATLQAGTAEIGKLAAGVAEIGNVKNSGTFAVQAAQSGTYNITNISGTISLPTGAATSAKQLADGHNVTIDNANGASAVHIQDGGNSITVDNGGTFAVQATLDAETTKVIGTINVAAAQTIAVTNGGTFATQATLQAGTAEIGKLAAGVAEIGNIKNAGTFATQATLQAGSALAADVGLSGARTSGGTTLYKNIDVDAKDEVKATAGQVYWIHAINTTAAPVFLKFYDLAAASVTVGTTVPDLTFPVPGNADSDGAGFTLAIPNGIAFGTGITIAGTLLVADNNNDALGANALIVNLGFA